MFKYALFVWIGSELFDVCYSDNLLDCFDYIATRLCTGEQYIIYNEYSNNRILAGIK